MWQKPASPCRTTARLLTLGLALFTCTPVCADWPLPPTRTSFLYFTGYGTNNMVSEYWPNGTYHRTITNPNLSGPQGIAVDENGNLIVACSNPLAKIVRMDTDGNLLPQAGIVVNANLNFPKDIANSPLNDKWYVTNYLPGRIQVFDANWLPLTTIAPAGMDGASGIAFDANGNFAVTAWIANKVYRFNAAGALLGVINGQMGASGIAVDSQGNHYVANQNSNSVSKFDAAWNPLMTFNLGTIQPYGIAINEHDILTVTPASNVLASQVNTQGVVLGSFVVLGVNAPFRLAYQTSPRVFARWGSVTNPTTGLPVRTLAVNGQSGDSLGRVSLGQTQPFTLSLAAPPAGPNPADFVVFMRVGEPGLADVQTLPSNIGFLAFPTSLTSATSYVIANTLSALLGVPWFPTPPAPTTIYSNPNGLGVTGTFTFEGITIDSGSASTTNISATNALVITVN